MHLAKLVVILVIETSYQRITVLSDLSEPFVERSSVLRVLKSITPTSASTLLHRCLIASGSAAVVT